MENKVLEFIDDMHRFEREKALFTLRDETGTLYWDIVRPQVLIVLFYTCERKKNTANAPAVRPVGNKIFRLLKWFVWLFVNECNFYFSLRRRPYLFLMISRFFDAAENRSYDAVADEIHAALREDSLAVETFKNAQTDVTRFGHRYQTFHSYTLRQWYKRKKFVAGKSYALSSLLKERFPASRDENWDRLIQETLLEYQAEYRFMSRLLRRARPKALFFSGGAKGIIAAARNLGIKTIEIQHSPLNRADLHYSYNQDIDYSAIATLPEYLLVNSDKWQERLYYPPEFVNVGSDYFHRSSRQNPATGRRNKILFVSDPLNHDLIKRYISGFIERNDLSDFKVVFKLHSAETDRYEAAKHFFAGRPEVEVILNERNISALLDESCATFVIYSTVAYQAVQKGLKVFLLKTGYYEGGYDLFGLPNVKLTDMDEQTDLSAITDQSTFEPVEFFEPFEKEKLHAFVRML
jgi:hypothetical protein